MAFVNHKRTPVAGLVPATYVFFHSRRQDVDARVKPAQGVLFSAKRDG